MAADESARIGVRGLVSGFVVQEPQEPIKAALRRLKTDCAEKLSRLRMAMAATPVPLAPEAAEATGPIVAGPEHTIQDTIPSIVPLAPETRRAWLLKGEVPRLMRLAAHGLRRKMARLRHSFVVVAHTVAPLFRALKVPRALIDLPTDLFNRLPALPLATARKVRNGIAAIGTLTAALLVLVPESVDRPAPQPLRAEQPPQPVWREIIKPLAVFTLEGGALSGHASRYQANARSDGAREDVMSFVPANQPDVAPVAVMVVHRHPPIETTEQRLFPEIARRAAAFGKSVVSSGQSAVIATKFGDLEVMDVRFGSGSGEQACLAFRHVAWSAPLAITGWRCGTAEKPIDRPALVCFVDRLDLMSAGQELWLRDYFAESERFRSFCANKRVTAGKVERAGDAPALRPEVTGTVKKQRPAKPRASKPQKRPAKKPGA